MRDWLTKHNFLLSMRRRAVSYVLLTLMVFVVFLSGGVGITAYAANSSLPGDALYPLKTTTEMIRARWAPDSAAQTHLYLDFAGQRLVEMQALIREGRLDDIDEAAREFERDIQGTLRAIEALAQHQPERAGELKGEAVGILRIYSNTLTHMLTDVPDEARSAIQSALHNSESAAASLATTDGDDDDNDDGNVGGRGGDDDCLTHSPGSHDDDGCEPPQGEVGGTATPTPQPPATPSNNSNNNSGGSNSGGDDDAGQDDDEGDDDGGGDDDDDDDEEEDDDD